MVPKPVPVLPSKAEDATNAVWKSSVPNDMTKAPVKKTAIYVRKNATAALTVLLGSGFPSNFMPITAFGCTRIDKLRHTNLPRIITLITFIAPPVEEEEPPINVSVVSSV